MARLFLVAFILHVSGIESQDCLCTKIKDSNSHCIAGTLDKCECNIGFKPSESKGAYQCLDIDECGSANNCVQSDKCINTAGYYECGCDSKFVGDGWKDGTGCQDKDECAFGTNCNGGTCQNLVAKKVTDRGFQCKCNAGYATLFSDQVCSPQRCIFDLPAFPARGTTGTCENYKNQEGKIQLQFDTSKSECNFGCISGYKRVGGTFTCTPNNPNGEKTADKVGVVKEVPLQCVEQQCDISGDSLNRLFPKAKLKGSNPGPLSVFTGNTFAELECKDGFIQTAGGVVRCAANGDRPYGSLTGEITCEGTPCGRLFVPNSDHADGHNKDSKTSDTVEVKCNDGFELDGSSTAVCSADGRYSSSWKQKPSCQPTCAPLTVANGKPSIDSAASVGDAIYVICDEGYALSGTYGVCDKKSSNKAEWINVPTCEEIQCPYKKIPNSDRDINGIRGKVGEAVEVTCDGAEHSFAIVCFAVDAHKAAWTSYVSCPAVKCPAEPVVDNGKLVSTEVLSSKVTVANYVCEDGYKKLGSMAVCSIKGPGKPSWKNIPTCREVPCPRLAVPFSNINVGFIAEDGITEVDVQCADGYIGQGTAVCVIDGPEKKKWTNVITCKKASCGPLQVANSNRHDGQTKGNTNDVLNVRCDDGYIGPETWVQCRGVDIGVAKWFDVPTCRAAKCGELNVDNAKTVSGDFKTGDTVNLICDDGFMQVGSSPVCSANGRGRAAWTNIPKCEEASCGPLIVPYSNHKDGNTKNAKPQETANVECDEGFGTGRSTAVCVLENSRTSWTNLPTCTPSLGCGPLQVDGSKRHSNGSFVGVLGDSYLVTCPDGYIGTSFEVSCDRFDNESARWSPNTSSIECTPVTCPALNVDNGNVSSTYPSLPTETVYVTCNKGYKQVGGSSVLCSPTGPGKSAWGDIPTCEEAFCDPLIVANGKASSNSPSKTNETVGIICETGFTEVFSEATCKATSQGAEWDRIPTCEGIPCDPLVVPHSDHKDGHNKDSTAFDQVNVTCDHGYTGGFSVAECIPDETGKSTKWVGLPDCQPVTCAPLVVANGKASSNSPSNTKAVVEVSCNYGFKISGFKEAVCMGDGPGKAAWEPVPTCEAASCPLTKIPNSDKADGITGKLGDAVAVKCNGATHAFAVTCVAIGSETAFWSGLVSCPETPGDRCPALVVEHGKASSTSFAKESETVDIICDDGYEKIGENAVCSSTGSGGVAWTNIPACKAVSCPEKKIPNSDKADGITAKVNEKVVVQCDGATEKVAILCIGIGAGEAIWTYFPPCPVPSCPVPIVENGKASSTSPSQLGDVVEITCDNGYEVAGEKSATCITDEAEPQLAVWDQIPECNALPCQTKPIPSSDKTLGITGNVGDTVVITCDSGDEQVATCSAFGADKPTWTGVYPCPGSASFFVAGPDNSGELAALSTYLLTILLLLYV